MLRRGLSTSTRYTRLTPIEHVLRRPGMYLGAMERATAHKWVYDARSKRYLIKKMTWVPGLVKTVDEILVNALDNRFRDPSGVTDIAVMLDGSRISVLNNGAGIPVEMHETEGIWVPELVLGHLLSGSNFDDETGLAVGGAHGLGAKLTNILSNRFSVETFDAKSRLLFRQTWLRNMRERVGDASVVALEDCSASDWPELMDESGKAIVPFGEPFTRIEWDVDLERFLPEKGKRRKKKEMTTTTTSTKKKEDGGGSIDPGTAAAIRSRVVDVAGVGGVRTWWNGVEVGGLRGETAFEGFVRLHVPDDHPVVVESIGKGWEVGVSARLGEAPPVVSFANGLRTDRGGVHVDAVLESLSKQVAEWLRSKGMTLAKKEGIEETPSLRKALKTITPALVRDHTLLFLSASVEQPRFDAQSKEALVGASGVSLRITRKFAKQVAENSGVGKAVIETLVEREKSAEARAIRRIAKATKAPKGADSRIHGIPKLEDAHWAGGKHAQECTLILTEGDSAKALAVAGLAEVGREKFGVFPLRGKLRNVRGLSVPKALQNEEVAHLVKILGLDPAKPASADPSKLRYGHVMVMADQDLDGSHIKGLVINLFHALWPKLLHESDFLEHFITPVLKAKRGSQVKEFYSTKSYQEWLESDLEEHQKWRVKYYKGLGTNSAAEGREYFRNINKHRIPFAWGGEGDGDRIDMAFAKDRSADRKQWLQSPTTPTTQPSSTHATTFSEFVDQELIEFSRADIQRSIPSVVDGLKPSQRKVLYGCFKRAGKVDLSVDEEGVEGTGFMRSLSGKAGVGSEVKVAQLAGYVAEHTAYHHGEASLLSTIVNMAHDFVGSNNLPLLSPIGQFGTRLSGGKDAASPRYIFTRLSPIARFIFPPADDLVLDRVHDDGQVVEPVHYAPVIPFALVNGAEGIGTGWSTQIPQHNPLDLIQLVRTAIQSGQAEERLHHWAKGWAWDEDGVDDGVDTPLPWVRGHKGTIEATKSGEFVSKGKFELLMHSPRSSSRKRKQPPPSSSHPQDFVDSKGGLWVRVTELPIRKWTEDYKVFLEKEVEKGVLTDIIESYDERKVEFSIRFSPQITTTTILKSPSPHQAIEQLLRLAASTSTRNVHLISPTGIVERYTSPQQILDTFLPVRLDCYQRRLSALRSTLSDSRTEAATVARFVDMVVDGTLILNNRSRDAVHSDLTKHGFNPTTHSSLLSLPLISITKERALKSQAKAKAAAKALESVSTITPSQLWASDLDALEEALHGERVE